MQMSQCSDTDSAADVKPPKPAQKQIPDRTPKTRRALSLQVSSPIVFNNEQKYEILFTSEIHSRNESSYCPIHFKAT